MIPRRENVGKGGERIKMKFCGNKYDTEFQVQCKECREDMTAVSLAGYTMTQNGRAEEAQQIWKTLATGEEPRAY